MKNTARKASHWRTLGSCIGLTGLLERVGVGGGEKAVDLALAFPLGAFGIEPRIGARWPWTGVRVAADHTTRAHDGATTDREQADNA